jgi:3-methyladenine DNA glycosylase/8-oxoguanine DNA glycosylase
MAKTIEFALQGPGGEPVDLWRTINGHGVTSLPPMSIDEQAQTLRVTLTLPGFPPRSVTIGAGRPGFGSVRLHGESAGVAEAELVLQAVRHILRLDEDLSPFYALAASDAALCWVARGAGRMTRCQTVFEDIVKTICTTNCTWSATVRMVNGLVAELGEPAPDAPRGGWEGRAFPIPAAMAGADDELYRGTVRCGYRSAYLKKLAQAVVDGDVDLEELGTSTQQELSDDELAQRLLALPGVGPYATAHIMMMLGRYSRLIFDSWTRPTYAKIAGRDDVTDMEIRDRFERYGRYAGLAFWLTITRDWLDDGL